MAIAKLNSKGQITLPEEFREHLNLQAGSLVEIMINAEGAVVVTPVRVDITTLKGMLSRRPGSAPAADKKWTAQGDGDSR